MTPLPATVRVPGVAEQDGQSTSRQRRRNAIAAAAWLVLATMLLLRHQVWRDEMRALSLALSGEDLAGMVDAVRGEGHPLLWYLLLRATHGVVQNTICLKIAGLAVATGVMILVIYKSPFHFWLRVLICFSPLFLFEYSVVSRNYGISVLMMFIIAILMSRPSVPTVSIGILLLLLENTNIHSIIFAGGYFMILVDDWWRQSGTSRRASFRDTVFIPGVLAIAGIVLCFLTVWPTRNDLAVRGAADISLATSLAGVLLSPGSFFEDVLPSGILAQYQIPFDGLLGTLILYSLVFSLRRAPVLLASALLGIFGLSLLFAFAYPGAARHQGLILPYLISLHWIMINRKRLSQAPDLDGFSIRIALPAILSMTLLINVQFLAMQFFKPFSMSEALGKFLTNDPALSQAIVLSDLDYNIESLAYYADNPTYLIREGRYGRVPFFTKRSTLNLDLGALLETAQRLRRDSGKPVVILVTAQLDEASTETVTHTAYGWTFRFNDRQLSDFRSATRKAASFRGSPTENYDVYVVD